MKSNTYESHACDEISWFKGHVSVFSMVSTLPNYTSSKVVIIIPSRVVKRIYTYTICCSCYLFLVPNANVWSHAILSIHTDTIVGFTLSLCLSVVFLTETVKRLPVRECVTWRWRSTSSIKMVSLQLPLKRSCLIWNRIFFLISMDTYSTLKASLHRNQHTIFMHTGNQTTLLINTENLIILDIQIQTYN